MRFIIYDMIKYQKHILSNGLTLIVQEVPSTPLVTVNTLYNVGARDEDPARTGFAHLFEHLMFGGTPEVPDFDKVVSQAGGDSNASTCNDFTNYYITLPVRYLETALWLESDRMRRLDFSRRSLEVQQSVVTEEYHYRYVNQPYGDKWMLLRPLSYKVHPYRWCTIGSDIRHVQEATLDDVKRFFYRYYRPNNAILSVVGNVKADEVLRLVERWYGDIPAGDPVGRNWQQEPEQVAARSLSVVRQVPSNALMMGYVMCDRFSPDFYATDLISDILSSGQSSRMYNELVKQRGLFTELNAYITGDSDRGLFVVDGKMRDGVDFETARRAVEEQLRHIAENPLSDRELEKVVNRYESTFAYSQYKALDCAMALCYYERLNHLEWVNEEPAHYRETTPEAIQRVAAGLFRPEHQNTLFYESSTNTL